MNEKLDTIIVLLNTINKQFDTVDNNSYNNDLHHTANKNSNKTKIAFISNALFVLCLTTLIFGAVFFSIFNKQSTTSSFLGIRLYDVKTSSMEPVYPVGSVVVTRKINPKDLEVGNDITIYVKEDNRSFFLTHRIIEIKNNENGLLFRTKGLNSRVSDTTLFNESDIVGKVFLSVPALGKVLNFIGENQITFLLLVLCVFAFAVLIKRKNLVVLNTNQNCKSI